MLTEQLRANGYEVWIDVQGIHAATSWSREIVEAIDGCKVFIVILSTNSLSSPNVTKEVSLASESRKTILPVDIEQIELTVDLRYQLAGLQRVTINDIDSILKGLARLNVLATESGKPAQTNIARTQGDSRISLAVLPFDDLSPGKDNDWFADGLSDELINVLSELKTLRVTDRRTAMEYKGYKGKANQIARGLNVQYLIEGAVRKHGDQIKITVQLYDSLKNEALWNESHKGVMDDVFDIQESVAKKTIESLKLSLSLEEEKVLEAHPTENTKAYEYFLRAIQLADLNTRSDFEKALVHLDLAIELDPSFPNPYTLKALILSNLYRVYDNNPNHIKKAEESIENALSLDENLREAYLAKATLATITGKIDEAIIAAHKVIELNPNLTQGYFALGFAYSSLNDSENAIKWYRKAKEVNSENTFAYWNIFVHSLRLHDDTLSTNTAYEAIPLFKRRLELNPNDSFLRANLASYYIKTGKTIQANEIINTLVNDTATDAMILYNIGCLYVQSSQPEDAINILRKAFKKGFRNIRLIQTDNDLDPLRAREDFKQLLEQHTSE